MNISNIAGKILLAEPFMWDTNFKRTAILLCEHDNRLGSIGFVLNKRLEMKVNEYIDQLPSVASNLYLGGPVGMNTLHYIHTVGDLLENSTKIAEGIWWGGSFEDLKLLMDADLIAPNQVRFYLGYSGWGGGQLREEMETHSWIMTDATVNYVFNENPNLLWQQAMYNKGDQFTVISQIPDYANWN
jgi:putative transcriptional regulator